MRDGSQHATLKGMEFHLQGQQGASFMFYKLVRRLYVSCTRCQTHYLQKPAVPQWPISSIGLNLPAQFTSQIKVSFCVFQARLNLHFQVHKPHGLSSL